MTEKEAAEYLRIKFETLAKLRREGKGPPYSRIGGSIRYIKETVQNWVKTQERRKG